MTSVDYPTQVEMGYGVITLMRSRLRLSLLGLVALIALTAVGTALVVSHAKHSIQRGARWVGIRAEGGIALAFVCEPSSGIRHAYFYLWPWRQITLEKIDPGT